MQGKGLYGWAGFTGVLAAGVLLLQPHKAPLTLYPHASFENNAVEHTVDAHSFEENKYTGDVSADALSLQGEIRPRSRTIQQAEVATSPTPTTSGLEAQADMTNATMEYFLEIALGSEWAEEDKPDSDWREAGLIGAYRSAVKNFKTQSFSAQDFDAQTSNLSTAPRIHRWHRRSLRVGVQGNPTAQDWQVLRQVTAELSQLTGMAIALIEVSADSQSLATRQDIDIHFRPAPDFAQLLPHYQPGNKGFAWVWWGQDGIDYATVLIESREKNDQGITSTERAHLIREELTQSLGLLQDSWKYPDSIFYQGWTETSQYSAMDKAVIQALYHPSIQSNMTMMDVRQMIAQQSGLYGFKLDAEL